MQEARFILVLTVNFKYCAYLVPVKTTQYHILGGCNLLLFDFKCSFVCFPKQQKLMYLVLSSFCLVWIWGLLSLNHQGNWIVYNLGHRPHSFVCLTTWGKRITGIGDRFYCKWNIFSFYEVKWIVCINFYCVFDLLFCRWVCCSISCQSQQQWWSLCTETDVC